LICYDQAQIFDPYRSFVYCCFYLAFFKPLRLKMSEARRIECFRNDDGPVLQPIQLWPFVFRKAGEDFSRAEWLALLGSEEGKKKLLAYACCVHVTRIPRDPKNQAQALMSFHAEDKFRLLSLSKITVKRLLQEKVKRVIAFLKQWRLIPDSWILIEEVVNEETGVVVTPLTLL
jgi:hypothetical protein